MHYEQNFLAISPLPDPIKLPAGELFKLYTIVGDMLYLSGHGPSWGNDFSKNLGKVGKDLTVEQATEAARVCMLNLLQTTRQALGTLDHVESIVEVFGMVNCIETFTQQSDVVNGASGLLHQVFGDHGLHTRVAMGAGSLPFNFSVEVKMSLKIHPHYFKS